MEQYYFDIAIVVIVLMAIIIGARRGIVRMLISLAALVASLFGAAWCANNLTAPAVAYVQPLLTEKITTALQTTNAADATGIISMVVDAVGSTAWDAARTVVDAVGIDNAMKLLGEAGLNATMAMMTEMLTPIVHTAIFVIVFILLRVLLRLVAIPLNLVDRLPVVHGLSHWGGGLLGAVGGAIIVSVGLWGCEQFAWVAPEIMDASRLSPYFAEGAWINEITALFQ